MTKFLSKPIENNQKTPEYVTPGDVRGMAKHLFEVDYSIYDASQQMGRYPARTAIESVQKDAAIASALTNAVAQAPAESAPDALDIEQIRARINQESVDV